MNIRFLCLFSLFMFIPRVHVSFADDGKQALMLELKNGSRVAYYLDSRPKISFSASELLLSAFDVEVSYPFDEVLRYTFEESYATSVSNSMEKPVAVQIHEDEVSFSNLAPDTNVFVYTVDGRNVSTLRIGKSGNCRVSLENMPVGIYVIQYGKFNVKVVKK